MYYTKQESSLHLKNELGTFVLQVTLLTIENGNGLNIMWMLPSGVPEEDLTCQWNMVLCMLTV